MLHCVTASRFFAPERGAPASKDRGEAGKLLPFYMHFRSPTSSFTTRCGAIKRQQAAVHVASDLNRQGTFSHSELPSYATMNPKYLPIHAEVGRLLG
jgi:hypothetical protein